MEDTRMSDCESESEEETDIWESALDGSEDNDWESPLLDPDDDYWECSSDGCEDILLEDSTMVLDVEMTESSSSDLYKGCPITIEESVLAILSFQQSAKLSGASTAQLLDLIELHCLKPNNCIRSPFKLLSQFKDVKTPLKSYYFCSKCSGERESSTDICAHCEALKPTNIQVLVLSLIDQITSLYERPGFIDKIQHRFHRKKINEENIESIYDGSIYMETGLNDILQKFNISLMWNTDGVCFFSSSQMQFWPLYLVINELPIKERYKRENLILAAVYIGKKKPNPNIFLKYVYPMVEELRQGFKVNVPGFAEQLQVTATLICGTCDSPAKAAMMNIKLYSGFYSCPKCLAKGEKSERTDDVMVHPYEPNCELRTDENYEMDATLAVANHDLPKDKRASHGVKGPSFLYLMVNNMIISTSLDQMHYLYLGVMRQLLGLWFDKKYRKEGFSLYKVRNVVNSRLLAVLPPNFVKRLPRSLEQKALFKAHEFMLLLYYYLLPILEDTMKQIYFHNFKQLVAGFSLLNQRSISKSDINKAKSLLTYFVTDFEVLYGMRHVSFNLHLILHASACVEALGPAYFTSCFRFEDLNGQIRSLIHGSLYAGSQLSSKLSLFLQLPLMIDNLRCGLVKEYCKKIGKKWKRLRLIEKMSENTFSVGKYSKLIEFPGWLVQVLGNLEYTSVFSFERMTLNGILIVSETYRQSKSYCSFYMSYTYNGNVYSGLVKTFIKITKCSCIQNCLCPGNFFAVANMYESEHPFSTTNPPVEITHIKKCIATNVNHLVPIDCILNVCIRVEVNNKLYLCSPLNDEEIYN